MKEMLDMTVDHTRIVAEWKETKYIVVSSSFFMVPAIYGLYNNLYFLSLISFVISLISINFWRHATYSWGRIADRIFSKISFLIFLYYSIKYASLRIFFFLQYAGMFTFVYFYYMSNKHHNTIIWWKYHMIFHIFGVFTKLIIIKCVSDYYKNNENMLLQ
jgi:hypothetical protein